LSLPPVRSPFLFLEPFVPRTIHARLQALAQDSGATESLPFAWRSDCPPLADKKSAELIIRYVADASEYFQAKYGVPAVLLWVDTWSQAAGLEKSGDDNDTAATAKALGTLRAVSAQTGVLCVAVDHYGKVVEAGTRGSSNKEGSTDAVLSCLAEREPNGGAVDNTRLAVRKQRDGLSGFEVPFTPEVIDIGVDEEGDMQTAVTLSWGDTQVITKVTKMGKATAHLMRIYPKALDEHGIEVVTPDENAMVMAVDQTTLEQEFVNTYSASKRSETSDDDSARVSFFDEP
jgi:hypothetical protein